MIKWATLHGQLCKFIQWLTLFTYLFGVLHHCQHCAGHIMMGSFVGRGNQYIQLVKVLYCKLPTIGKQLPTFPLKVGGLNCWPQRWEASVLPLSHWGSLTLLINSLFEPKFKKMQKLAQLMQIIANCRIYPICIVNTNSIIHWKILRKNHSMVLVCVFQGSHSTS